MHIAICDIKGYIASMRSFTGIKPQDVLIMLKLIVSPHASQKDLANSLFISQGEISHGVQRLKISKLLNHDRKVNTEACLEFLVHGLKYLYPAQIGTLAVGIPTSYARPGFKFVKFKEDDIYVWPHAEGKIRGIALKPFYETLPQASLQDEKLYSLASLVEMIRMGRAREQNLASEKLKGLFKSI